MPYAYEPARLARPALLDLGERLTAAGATPRGECSRALFRSLAALGAAWNNDPDIVSSLVGLLAPEERGRLETALAAVSAALAVDPQSKEDAT